MFKFISFYPQVNKEETVPNNNILWMCTYKLLGDQIQIPFELLHFLNSCDCPLPLKHFLEQMDYYDLNIEFNSDYQKQYCMYDGRNAGKQTGFNSKSPFCHVEKEYCFLRSGYLPAWS